MNEMKRAWLVRILAGGLCGMAGLFLLGGLFNGARFQGAWEIVAVSPQMAERMGLPLAAVLQFGLYFLFGAGLGVATLPFADEGEQLALRSALHFLYMAAVSSALVLLTGWALDAAMWLVELLLLVLLYVMIWLGRWIAWCGELDAIREKLGLAPAPSPLRWRESLPHIGFAALLCLAVPAALSVTLFYGMDDPTRGMITIITPLTAIAACVPGISLGRRHGFCPLYPLACGGFYLLSLFGLYFVDRYRDPTVPFLVCATVVLAAALAGNLCGGLLHQRGRKKEAAA